MIEEDEYIEIEDYTDAVSIQCPECNEDMKIIDYKDEGILYCYCSNCDEYRYMQDADEEEISDE